MNKEEFSSKCEAMVKDLRKFKEEAKLAYEKFEAHRKMSLNFLSQELLTESEMKEMNGNIEAIELAWKVAQKNG